MLLSSHSPLPLLPLLLLLLLPLFVLSTLTSHHTTPNSTQSLPPHYHHHTFNRTHYYHPSPNQTHPHPVPAYWMPDTSTLTLPESADPPLVRIDGKQLLVEGRPFHIQGVCYSPIPVGESPSFDPRGDYFTLEYTHTRTLHTITPALGHVDANCDCNPCHHPPSVSHPSHPLSIACPCRVC